MGFLLPADLAANNKVVFFEGSEDDVLSRFVGAAEMVSADVVVRITGDNPLLDADAIALVVEKHLSGEFHYSCSTKLPVGMDVEVVNTAVLKDILQQPDITPADREHVTHYIKKSGKYRINEIDFQSSSISGLRLTVDYPADFALMHLLFSTAEKHRLSGIELVSFAAHTYPWIFEVNRHLQQKRVYKSRAEEHEAAIELLRVQELMHTAQFIEVNPPHA